MDPAGSKLEFVATFEKTAAPGVFREFDARLRFDPEKPEGSRLDVTVKVTSADMSSADVNSAIRGPEWFDFGRFPQAEFHSTEIRRAEANRYLARGTLSLKGQRKFESEKNEKGYHRIERSYGTFARYFSVPDTVDPEKIQAEYKAGVLTVTLPKKELAKPRAVRIDVKQ